MAPENPQKLWDYDRPDISEGRFRDLLEMPGIDLLFRVEVLTHLARAVGLQGKFREGHDTLDDAEAELGPLTADAPRVAARVKLERGRLLNSSGDGDHSIGHFLDAWGLAFRAKADDEAIDAAHMLGIVVGGDEGLAWNKRAFEIAAKSTDRRAKAWRASLANNIGWALFERDDLVGALDSFTKALAYLQEYRSREQILIARWAIARTLRALDRIDEALAIQESLHADLERTGAVDHYVEEELGECLWAAKRKEEARPWIRRALAGFRQDEWMVEHDAERLARLSRFLESE